MVHLYHLVSVPERVNKYKRTQKLEFKSLNSKKYQSTSSMFVGLYANLAILASSLPLTTFWLLSGHWRNCLDPKPGVECIPHLPCMADKWFHWLPGGGGGQFASCDSPCEPFPVGHATCIRWDCGIHLDHHKCLMLSLSPTLLTSEPDSCMQGGQARPEP